MEEIKYNIRNEKFSSDWKIKELERFINGCSDKSSALNVIKWCENIIAEDDIKMQLTKGDI
jgi:hypothetical protein